MGQSSVDRLARSKRPTVERAEIHIPPAPEFPLEAVTGDPARRAQAVASFNRALQKWRNDAWSIEAPFVPDAELQNRATALEDTTAKMATKLDRAAIDLNTAEETIATIETNITHIDNSITTINNQITVIEGNQITGSGIVQANGAAPPSAITGSTGHFPYWQPSAPYLSDDSSIYTDGTLIGIGTVSPVAQLHVTTTDAVTGAVTNVLRVEHKISGGGFLAVNGGTGIVLAGASASAVDRDMASMQARWTTSTDATRSASIDWQTVNAGAALATQMTLRFDGNLGIGTTNPTAPVQVVRSLNAQAQLWLGQNLSTGLLNSAEIVLTSLDRSLRVGAANSIHSTSALTNSVFFRTDDALRMNLKNQTASGTIRFYVASASTICASFDGTNQGFRVGMSPAFTIVPGARFHVYQDDTSDTALDVVRLTHDRTTGAGGNNIGTGIMFAAETSTTSDVDMARIVSQWSTATHATRASRIDFYVCNAGSAPTQVMRLTADGRLGIGETGPSGVIHVKASSARAYFESPDNTTVGFVWRPNGTNTVQMTSIAGPVAGIRWLDGAATTEWMRIDASGNILIGRTTGTDRLDVSIDDAAATNAVTTVATLHHSTTAGTPVAGFGTAMRFQAESSANASRDMAYMQAVWTTPTDATRTAALEWQMVNSAAAAATRMALSGAGGLSVGDGTNTIAVGVINAVTGFRVNNTSATAGWVLTSDGTNFVPAAPPSITTPLPIADGGTNNTAFNTNSVIFYDGVRLTDDGAAFTYAASGDNQLLVARTMGAASSDLIGYYALNSSAAAAGAANQQWSPPFIFEGQGWQTGTGTSQAVRFRNYVVPVQGTTNPTGYWILERSINNAAYVELLRADSTGYLLLTKDALGSIDTTLGQSVFGLALQNNTAATAVTTTQDAPTIIWKGAAWNSSALSSQDWRWRALMKGVTVAGTTRSYMRIDSSLNGANFANPFVLSSAGGASLGALIEAAFGVLSTQVGYQIAGGATSGTFLRGNGTNFVQSTIQAGDITAAAMAHNMLSATHTDTLASAVSRGSLIVGNVTPLWAELNVDTNKLLVCNGTDTTWSTDLTWDESANVIAIGATLSNVGSVSIRPDTTAVSATRRWLYLFNNSTSSTVNTSNYSIYATAGGVWDGGGASETVAGVFIASGNTVSNKGIYAEAEGAAPTSISAHVVVGGSGTNSYGAYINNDTAGTNTYGAYVLLSAGGTNFYGLYVSASGATTLNYALYIDSGATRLGAGVAAANGAPLKFTSGTNLTTAEAGAMEYNGRFFLTDTDATRRHIVQAVNDTKVTAGAPYANDGYVNMVINGTTFRVMTTA